MKDERGTGWTAPLLSVLLATLPGTIVLVWNGLGGMDWDAVGHDPSWPPRWRQWIHPPGYDVLLGVWDRGAAWTGWSNDGLALATSAAMSGVCAGFAVILGRRCGWRWAAGLATLLIAFRPDTATPFEAYPVAAAACLGAVVCALVAAGRAHVLVASAVLAWSACELSLVSTLVLAPVAVVVAFEPGEGRRRARWAMGLAAAAFGASCWPGLFEVLEMGPGNLPSEVLAKGLEQVTLERTNPLLLLATAAWLVPGGDARLGRALTAGWWLHAAAILGLMATGNAIGGSFRSSHHYFVPGGALLALLAATGLARAWTLASGGWRVVVAGLALSVAVSQVGLWGAQVRWVSQDTLAPPSRPGNPGKKAWAEMEAELRCIQTRLGETPAAAEARAALLERHGVTMKWIEWSRAAIHATPSIAQPYVAIVDAYVAEHCPEAARDPGRPLP